MARKFMEVATTPAVRQAQRHYYGREQDFAPDPLDERTPLGADEAAFIAERDSFYLGTVGETGWPYLQHRGGPPGFLHVLDAHTLAFADLKGNRQLLSTGNLAGGNDRAALFLMDYPQRARLKIMGHVRVLDARTEPELATWVALGPILLARTERVFVVNVVSFDWNCSQYITPRFTAEEVETYVAAPMRARLAALEARLRTVGDLDPL